MSKPAFRDMSIPYTESEMEEIRQAFKSCSTYNPEDESISVDEQYKIVEVMRLEANTDQMQVYNEYWRKYFGGRLYMDKSIPIIQSMNSPDNLMLKIVELFDVNKDGYIGEDELSFLLTGMPILHPKLADINMSYEDFVKECDTNKDKKASIQECVEWIKKKLASLN